MNAFFFVFLTLLVFIFQTVVLPSVSFVPHVFDLMIIDVLYLSLISKHHAAALAIALIGCMMDSVSGVPFFYHVFSYLWIYILVRLVRQMFFHHSLVLVMVLSILSVAVQQGLLIFSLWVGADRESPWVVDYQVLLYQLIYGLIVVPVALMILEGIRSAWLVMARSRRRQFLQRYRDEL